MLLVLIVIDYVSVYVYVLSFVSFILDSVIIMGIGVIVSVSLEFIVIVNVIVLSVCMLFTSGSVYVIVSGSVIVC